MEWGCLLIQSLATRVHIVAVFPTKYVSNIFLTEDQKYFWPSTDAEGAWKPSGWCGGDLPCFTWRQLLPPTSSSSWSSIFFYPRYLSLHYHHDLQDHCHLDNHNHHYHQNHHHYHHERGFPGFTRCQTLPASSLSSLPHQPLIINQTCLNSEGDFSFQTKFFKPQNWNISLTVTVTSVLTQSRLYSDNFLAVLLVVVMTKWKNESMV